MAGAGIISGFDMTSEAAMAKLSYVLGLPGLSLEGQKEVGAGLGMCLARACGGILDSGHVWGMS